MPAQTCTAFEHPGYNSDPEDFEGEDPSVSFQSLSKAAESCGFCAILHKGIMLHQHSWMGQWRRFKQNVLADLPDAQIEQHAFVVVKFSAYPGVNFQVVLLARRDIDDEGSESPLIELEWYSKPDSPSSWGQFRTSPPIQSQLFSKAAVDRISGWLNFCTDAHISCNTPIFDSRPTRLLRIRRSVDDTRRESLSLNLEIVTPEFCSSYVAVSYCWAKVGVLKTQKDNFSDHLVCVPWSKVPLGIQQVARMISMLGFQFMWVDALCIVQQDESDWLRESKLMGSTFANAAAVFAIHSSDLAIEKDEPTAIYDPLHLDAHPVYCREPQEHGQFRRHSVQSDNWWNRAWCFQERLLARRIVHFGSRWDELAFECNEGMTCECNFYHERGTTMKAHWRRIVDSTDNHEQHCNDDSDQMIFRFKLWRFYTVGVVEPYNICGLSYETDRLPAISGVMRTLAPKLGQYYSGLWEATLLTDLLWVVHWQRKDSSRHTTYVAPTFAWASVTGLVWSENQIHQWSELPTSARYDFATVLDVSTTLATDDPFGRVSDGFICIRGSYATFPICNKPSNNTYLAEVSCGARTARLQIDTVQDHQRLEVGQEIMCVGIMRQKEFNADIVQTTVIMKARSRLSSALVLVPATEKRHAGCWNRIGFVQMDAEDFGNNGTRDFRIV